MAQTAAYCLLLPGPELHLTPLPANKKFRGRGNKEGAIKAFEFLQKEGLGVLKESVAARGTSKVRNKLLPDMVQSVSLVQCINYIDIYYCVALFI